MQKRFIVIEGPDGSGTSTHAEKLVKRLNDAGIDVLQTHEPTAGPIGKDIRRHLSLGDIPSLSLQLLFTADRLWHIEEVIRPALAMGKVVVSDRYALSTLVYGKALDIPMEAITMIHTKVLQPDLQIVLLPPFSTCMERLGKRINKEILEEESVQKKVYDLYRISAAEMSLPVIDTSNNMNESADEIWRLVQGS